MGSPIRARNKKFPEPTLSPALRFLLLSVCVCFRLCSPAPSALPVRPSRPSLFPFGFASLSLLPPLATQNEGAPFPVPSGAPQHLCTDPSPVGSRGWHAATQAHNGALRAAAGPGPGANTPQRGARPRRGSESPAIRASPSRPDLLWGLGQVT